MVTHIDVVEKQKPSDVSFKDSKKIYLYFTDPQFKRLSKGYQSYIKKDGQWYIIQRDQKSKEIIRLEQKLRELKKESRRVRNG